ncbi:hypothetical protein GOV03_01325, partial [Candidatus Woesearchaeota archaeon]|nr:hypothetical protein [Candidatus Woesearchaeota archaeon]
FYEANGEGIGEFVIGTAKEVVVKEPAVVEEEPEVVKEPIIEEPQPVEKTLISKMVSFFKNLFN